MASNQCKNLYIVKQVLNNFFIDIGNYQRFLVPFFVQKTKIWFWMTKNHQSNQKCFWCYKDSKPVVFVSINKSSIMKTDFSATSFNGKFTKWVGLKFEFKMIFFRKIWSCFRIFNCVFIHGRIVSNCSQKYSCWIMLNDGKDWRNFSPTGIVFTKFTKL